MFLNVLVKIFMLILVLLVATSCDGDSGSSSTDGSTPGTLAISEENNVALGGTQEFTVSLQNSANITTPVMLSIASTNPIVAPIVTNNCIHGLTTESPSCTVYLRGDSKGQSSIIVNHPDYNFIEQSITITKRWGTVGDKVSPDINFIDYFAFGGNKTYIAQKVDWGVYSSDNNQSWILVGGDYAFGIRAAINGMSADEHNVCLIHHYDNFSADVKCSTDNGVWHSIATLPPLFLPDHITLNNGYIYAAGVSPISLDNLQEYDTKVFYCSLSNCSNWQQLGDDAPFHTYSNSFISEKTTYIDTAFDINRRAIEYQDNFGNWQFYGYLPNMEHGFQIFSEVGGDIAIMPYDIPLNTQNQIYFADQPLGNKPIPAMTATLPVYTSGGGLSNLALSNGTVYIIGSDNYVYSASKDSPQWTKVGEDSASLSLQKALMTALATHNNKVYVATTSNHHAKIYVYSLTDGL